jgi:hypothetical protein
MGLKGFRLWAMGQINSTCRAPPQLVQEDDGHAGFGGVDVDLPQRSGSS